MSKGLLNSFKNGTIPETVKNTEENKVNAYYVYYDSLTNKLYNVKELINSRDTAYVLEEKILK